MARGNDQHRVWYSPSPSPRRREDSSCFRFGELGHFASKCSNVTSEYQCSHCSRNHLAKPCKEKPIESSQAMVVTTSTQWVVVPQRNGARHCNAPGSITLRTGDGETRSSDAVR